MPRPWKSTQMDQTIPLSRIGAEADARHNAFVYSIAQAINGSVPPICFSVGALAGYYLLGDDKSLATVPVTGYTVGIALGALPAAALMRRIGRRLGFVLGSLVAIFAGVIGALSIIEGSFRVFVVSMTIAGISGAFVQQYRFAAADSGGAEMRARAISWVLAGGVAAAVIGPQTVIHTHDLFEPIPFAGSFLAMSGLAALGLVVLLFLRGEAREAPKPVVGASGGRPLVEIAGQPRFVVAVICGMGAYALMSLMMTAAPLAMVACGLGEDNAALGIQWHVLAMFGPSFFTGYLIAHFGKERIIAFGMALLAAGAVVALLGIELLNFWVAMVLLGVGWNFGFIGATAMLTDTYRPEERSKVQGVNDALIFGAVALASFSSGQLLSSVGWDWLSIFFFPVIAICLAALAWLLIPGRRRAH
jgi:MFS family permease